ncbi:MAG: penicillin-binding protein 1A [Pseudomonadales bacterium]
MLTRTFVLRLIVWAFLALASLFGLGLSAAFLYLNPQVPDIESFSRATLKAPLRIYSADGLLIQEFGERLTPITYEEVPPLFELALLDTEDKRFWDHAGIDLVTLLNASWQLVVNRGAIKTGASTITMQLVKNISGDSEIRFLRKFKEMLLAIKIERELTKREILTLYLNIIPFGKHAFGIQAAAHTYYGKPVDQLSLAQTAMLAGIPQAPEAGNPINGPARALKRRNLVLLRMLEQGSISERAYDEAVAEPITAIVHNRNIELPALYVAEQVRREILDGYGRDAYNQGMIARTTINADMQQAAEKALRQKLLEYDRRHGYRGPEHRQLGGTDEYLASPEFGAPDNWLRVLDQLSSYGGQHPGIVIEASDELIGVLTKDLQRIYIGREGFDWARPYINVNSRGAKPAVAGDLVKVGDVIRYEALQEGGWGLGQHPKIQGALVALDPRTGAILALVGGFDFTAKQFNHATQARRQPGSNFKPFYYAGAMEEDGLTAASIYNDAPIVLPGGASGEAYRPKNSSDSFQGAIRLREALYRSINLVSARVVLDYGTRALVNYVSRFGFDTAKFPRDLQLAFGGGTIGLTPLEVAAAYAVFANGGFKVTPYLIAEIDSINSDTLFQAKPATVCYEPCEQEATAERVIDSRVAHIMNSILGDVIRRGTGSKVRRTLNRGDLHGKTGTTNSADIWFSGYTPDLAATVWTGFGDNSPVGDNEWGSTVPLETWVQFMTQALPAEAKTTKLPRPDGLVSVKIDPATGLRADPSDPDGVFEIFREELVPERTLATGEQEDSKSVEQIF